MNWLRNLFLILILQLLPTTLFTCPAIAQSSDLIVHNNTGATITVFTQNYFDDEIESRRKAILPNSIGRLEVPMGQSYIHFYAKNTSSQLSYRIKYNFYHSRAHEIEIFPKNFGVSAMFDQPGANDSNFQSGCDWVDLKRQADATGRDELPFSKGTHPQKDRCTEKLQGKGAICWQSGGPLAGASCTYKTLLISQITGGANKGDLYECKCK